jgi:hypothetical protein
MTVETTAGSINVGAPLPANLTLPGGVGCNAASPYAVTAAPGQTVLTVGANEEYQTIGAAVAAAQNGDLILVDPGTYTNDFADITAQVTIAGAGGMVNMVATVSPPNEKGIFVVDNNVQIDNIAFSGVSIPDADGGNGAGIRYQGGNMVLHNDAFVDNQDGILAAAVDSMPSNTISIYGSTFDQNGNVSGPNAGYTHNCYIGYGVTNLTASGNIFERANVGHELKSRATSNLITGNVFYDGPTGTASYSIDLPNGGADTVSGNIIEKGPDAENNAAIHFGGEGIPYAGSSLSITGNHIINDHGSGAIGLLNQTTLSASITGNEFDNFENATLGEGPFTQSGNTDENGNPIAPTSSAQFAPGTDVDDFSHDSLTHTVTLTSSNGVLGGGGLLTVFADAGHVTVIGGAGGLDYQEAPGFGGSTISTAAGASDTVVAIGQDAVLSAGNDSIVGGACNLSVQVDGNATIASGSANNAYAVNGTASIIGGGGSDTVQANATTSNAEITGNEGFLQITVSGGTAGFNITQGGATEQATIAGGASGTAVYDQSMNITTAGAGAGSVISFGAGTANVVSKGDDTINAGGATATVIVSSAAQIYAGTGMLAVYGHSETGVATVFGANGTTVIDGDTGGITYEGGASANTVDGGLSNISVQGGAGRMTDLGGSRQTITGGSGGIAFSTTGGADTISTQAGAHDTVSFIGACTLVSNGTDVISAGSCNSAITANGQATITGSTGNTTYALNGTDKLTAYGNSAVTVAGQDTVTAESGWTNVAVSSGGTLCFAQAGNTDHEAATITGGGATLSSMSTVIGTDITLGGVGDGVTLGAGHDYVTVSAAGAHLWTGSGTSIVTLNAGGAVLHAEAGATTVNLNDWADQTATTIDGGGGAVTQNAGCGNLVFIGGKGAAVLGGTSNAETVTAGAGNITLTGGGSGTVFTAGTGTATVAMTSGGGTVTFGAAGTSVTEAAWGAADIYHFNAGHGGATDTITGFRVGTDSLVFNGVSVTADVSKGGSSLLTLSDGTHINLVGVSAIAPGAMTVAHH